jgi:secondary thiamine-phosphate synthase enzyme
MLRQIEISTRSRIVLEDITMQVQRAVSESGVRDGACLVYVPHTTAGVTVNENADPSVQRDILTTLSKLVPRDGSYSHTEGNADAHIKASLVGSSAMVFIESGRLVLGTWQGIYLCEFDGPRRRRVLVKVVPDSAAA